MALQTCAERSRSIAPGFTQFATGQMTPFEPPADGRLLNAADVPQLLNNPASWLYHATRSEPLALIENNLTPQTVGSLTLEFLTSLVLSEAVRSGRAGFQRHRLFCEAGQGDGARGLD